MNQQSNEMVTTSVYIKKSTWERLRLYSGRHGISTILEELAEKWLNGEVEITIKPKEINEK